MLFSINPEWVFWMGSAAALLLVVLVAIAKPQASQSAQVMDSLGANRPAIDLKTAVRMFRQRKMWMFILYVIGVACVYDVFDQQFATFFKSFFATPEAGTRAFGFATTAGEICNAIIMFSSPWIINRIGAKNTLLIAGMVMAARMIGSSFATTAAEVVALKMLHALEVPFLLVGAFNTSPACLTSGCRRPFTWWASSSPSRWQRSSSPPSPAICTIGSVSRRPI